MAVPRGIATDRKFSLAYSALVRHYFDCVENPSNSVGVEYGNCPIECPENQEKPFDRFRASFCETCPKIRVHNKFKDLVTNELFYRFGDNDYKFSDLYSVFKNVLKCENLPPNKMSVKTFALLNIYNAELNRWKKMKEPPPSNN